MTTPTIGRIVHVLVNPAVNNGTDVAPAMITRVFGSGPSGQPVVNLRVWRDQQPADYDWATSRYLWADEGAARLAQGDAVLSHVGLHAFWPSREA